MEGTMAGDRRDADGQQPAGPGAGDEAAPAEESAPDGESSAGDAPGGLARPGGGDTQEFEPGDLDQPAGPETQVMPGGPETQVMPGPTEAVAERWAARAQVPPTGLEEGVAETEVWEGAERPPRGSLIPVLIVICLLLLAGLLALGVWLAQRDRGPGPAPLPTGVTTTPPRTTAAATTPATPTTSTQPPTTEPVVVVLPNLAGSDYDTAARELERLGFVPRRIDQESTEVAEGVVIGTDPAGGTPAVPGLTVRVMVSTGPPPITDPPTTIEPS
jgi:hypothetical protein